MALQAPEHPDGEGCIRCQKSHTPDGFRQAVRSPQVEVDDGQGAPGQHDSQDSSSERSGDSQRFQSGQQQNPQEVRIAHDVFAGIEDQPLPAREIFRIAKGNEGVVTRMVEVRRV